MKKRLFAVSFWSAAILFSWQSCLQAKDITILYTGGTHAMLYTCSCPVEKDGGVARRASAVKELRKDNPLALLLDSGAFFAGGVLDEYTQNTELDTERTLINLKAMDIMRYDAVAIGTNEFNFGRWFLEEQAQKSKMAFLSSNIKTDKFLPYIIKEVDGFKVAITAVSDLEALSKANGLTFIEPKVALEKTIAQLKQKNADFIVVLSQLNWNEDVNILKGVEGIDVAILGSSSRNKEDEQGSRIGKMIVVKPSWQGRCLNKLTLKVNDNKIQDFKNEEMRISDKFKDDPEITAILPRCFSEAGCKKEGFTGTCDNPGTLSAQCKFVAAPKISLTVVEPKDSMLTETRGLIKNLTQRFPGLVVTYLYFPEPQAKKMIKNYGIKTLPAYIFSKDIAKAPAFDSLKDSLEPQGAYYLLKPQAGGLSYYLEREKVPGKFDMFVSAYDRKIPELWEKFRKYNPKVHLLVMEKDDGFEGAFGPGEVEECLRIVCVEKYAPDHYGDYLKCRSSSMYSAWWEDCLKAPEKHATVKACAQGQEGKQLLRENISLNKELQVMFGPTYLMDNQEIFSSRGVPSQDEMNKYFKK